MKKRIGLEILLTVKNAAECLIWISMDKNPVWKSCCTVGIVELEEQLQWQTTGRIATMLTVAVVIGRWSVYVCIIERQVIKWGRWSKLNRIVLFLDPSAFLQSWPFRIQTTSIELKDWLIFSKEDVSTDWYIMSIEICSNTYRHRNLCAVYCTLK